MSVANPLVSDHQMLGPLQLYPVNVIVAQAGVGVAGGGSGVGVAVGGSGDGVWVGGRVVGVAAVMTIVKVA